MHKKALFCFCRLHNVQKNEDFQQKTCVLQLVFYDIFTIEISFFSGGITYAQ